MSDNLLKFGKNICIVKYFNNSRNRYIRIYRIKFGQKFTKKKEKIYRYDKISNPYFKFENCKINLKDTGKLKNN